MGRIEERFAALKREGRKAFVAYLTAGDPDLKATRKLIPALEAAGVDIVVGSALVRLIGDKEGSGNLIPAAASFAAEIRRAIDAACPPDFPVK